MNQLRFLTFGIEDLDEPVVYEALSQVGRLDRLEVLTIQATFNLDCVVKYEEFASFERVFATAAFSSLRSVRFLWSRQLRCQAKPKLQNVNDCLEKTLLPSLLERKVRFERVHVWRADWKTPLPNAKRRV